VPPLTPERVIGGYQSAVTQVRARVVAYSRAAWLAQGSYRDADVDRLVGLIVPRVQAGQVQVANLTSAYLASLASLREGTPVTPVPVDRGAVISGRGVPATEVYRRPAASMYTALSGGASFAVALNQGLTRLESIVGTDVQMAKVRQSRSSMRSHGWRFFRRTLTGNENCGLCVIASTQRYRTESLSPIHPGCDCGVAPIEQDYDPGQVINRELLEGTQSAIGDFAGTAERGARDLGLGRSTATGKRASDYTDVMIRDHGEYGPTLTWRADKFTRAADLA